jgi:gluconate 5-dehydrogenase
MKIKKRRNKSMSMFDLTGKVAVVTGASGGLGADAARAYVEAGADVAILARRKEKLDALKEELSASGKDVIAVRCDITQEDSVKAACEEILKHFGKVDILLNNAGVAPLGGVDTLTEEQWDAAMNTNLKGIFLMSKYIVPNMIERKYGKIVNIASVNAILADKPDMFARHAYNASKAGVRGLTMGMAATYGKHNITVNSIGPGLFETEMTSEGLFGNKEFMEYFNANNPMNRPGAKGELNGTIIYLSSDASNYVTSQHIIVDGGGSIV